MELFAGIYILFWLGMWAAQVYLCVYLAKRQGRDTTIALILGVIFGCCAIIGYLIVGDTEDMQVQKRIIVDERLKQLRKD